MKNESKNMQNIKERIKIINEYNIININRKKINQQPKKKRKKKKQKKIFQAQMMMILKY